MRMNLPLAYRRIISRALGDIEFNFYHHWFDVIFVSSAGFSVIFIACSSLRCLRSYRQSVLLNANLDLDLDRLDQSLDIASHSLGMLAV
jgi:hypothetical protein